MKKGYLEVRHVGSDRVKYQIKMDSKNEKIRNFRPIMNLNKQIVLMLTMHKHHSDWAESRFHKLILVDLKANRAQDLKVELTSPLRWLEFISDTKLIGQNHESI